MKSLSLSFPVQKLLAMSVIFLFGPVAASAACAGPYGFPDPICAPVPLIVNRLIYVALSLAGTIFFVMFLWGGFTWMTAGGEAKKVEAAQKTLKNAVIGMIILATSYILVVNIIGLLSAGVGSGS